jgi:hypothetical protein
MDAALVTTAVLALDAARANGTDVSFAGMRKAMRVAVDEDPMQAALVTVLGGSVLFYLAERGHNPKVVRFEDALVFCTTCLNVGYSDIFAKTPAGKAIASTLMTFGPALAAKLFDPPSRVAGESDRALLEAQRAIAHKLDAILGELRKE